MAEPFVAQPQRHTQSGRDTVNITIVPIIFIPGVMGSRLLMPGGRDWDPDSKGGMIGWAFASLDEKLRDLSVDRRPRADVSRIFASGARRDVEGHSTLKEIAGALKLPVTDLYANRGWAGVAWGFYGIILQLLEATLNDKAEPLHSPTYAFGYDFRRSNFDSGQALLDFILNILGRHPGAQQVILVTHSMGGLVARAALAQNPSVAASIRGVVHGAQPANGAVVAYRRFLTAATRALDGGLSPEGMVIRGIIGTTPSDYATLQAGLPGPMQLLPNHIFHTFQSGPPWLRTSPQVDLSDVYGIYENATVPGIMRPTVGDPNFVQNAFINSALTARLETARAFHAALATVGHPNTHVLFSDGVTTDAHVDLTAKTPFAPGTLQTASGDGTVPADSARCPNIPESHVRSRKHVVGVDHAGVYGNAAFNDLVLDAIRVILS